MWHRWIRMTGVAALLSPLAASAQDQADPTTAAPARQAAAKNVALRKAAEQDQAIRPAPLAPVLPNFRLGVDGPPRIMPIAPEAEAAAVEATLSRLAARLEAVGGRAKAASGLTKLLRYRTPSGLVVDVTILRSDDEAARYDIVLEETAFDITLTGDSNAGKARLASGMQQTMRRTLQEVVRSRQLTAAEEARLRLAGGLDVKHLMDRVEERRRDFEAARGDLKSGLTVLHGLSDLQGPLTAPFGEGSLFAKTLAKIQADREAARPATPDRP